MMRKCGIFRLRECGKAIRGTLRNVPHLIFRKLPLDNFPHSAIRKIPAPVYTSPVPITPHLTIHRAKSAVHVVNRTAMRVFCGRRIAECGKLSRGNLRKIKCGTFRKVPLIAFPHSAAEKFRISASFTVELPFDDLIWLDLAAYFYLWCRGMFRFGYQQYMFTLHVVEYITFVCVFNLWFHVKIKLF